MLVRFSGIVAVLLTAASCTVQLDAPPGVTITCTAGGICPGGLVCVQDVNACVEPGTSCVEQRGTGYFPATDGNVCTRDGAAGVCRSGACIRCGDGVIDEGETCDDGNLDSSDACPVSCLTARCGDGFAQAGVEACDDGKDSNADACLVTCVANVCGDGFVDAAAEECDDKNANENDGCALCRTTVWQPSLAFGLGRDSAAPATASITCLGPLTSTRSGLLYAGWSQVVPSGDFAPTESTLGGVYVASAAANVVLPVTRRGGALMPDTLPEAGLARSLQLGLVPGLTTDARGVLYLTMLDYVTVSSGVYVSFGAYILRIDVDGTLHLVAGDAERCAGTDELSCGGRGRARDATFSELGGLAFDRRGRLNIVDGPSVRFIDTDGTIQLRTGLASTGCATTGCGDGGSASNGRFKGPLAIAVDGNDNLYIADYGDHRVRRIDANEQITTILGNGAPCASWPDCGGGALVNAPSGLASDGASLFIVDDKGGDRPGGVVRRLVVGQATAQTVFGSGGECSSPGCGDEGSATAAGSGFIDGIAVLDNGRIALTDVVSKNDPLSERRPSRIRVVDLATNRVSALVGSLAPEPSLVGNLPTSHDGGMVTYADDGTILFASESRVFAIDQTTNHVVLVAGGPSCNPAQGACVATSGSAATFGFSRILDIAAGDGKVYVADYAQKKVFEVAGGMVRHVFGSDTVCGSAQCPAVADARQAQIKDITGIDYAAGHLYVADPTSHTVWDATIDAGAMPFAGTGADGSGGDSGPASGATLRCPNDVLASTDGAIYIVDTDACKIRAVRNGTITTYATGPNCVGPGPISNGNDCGRWAMPADLDPLSIAEDGAGLVIGSSDTASRIAGGSFVRIAGALGAGEPTSVEEGALATDLPHRFVRVAAQAGRPLLIKTALLDTVVVRRLDAAGRLHLVLGSVDGSVTGGYDVAELTGALAAARLDSHSVLLADGAVVRRVDTARREVEPSVFSRYGSVVSTTTPTLARYTTPVGFKPDGIAVDRAAHRIYLSEAATGDFFTVTAPDFADPVGWTVVSNGRLRDSPGAIVSPRALAIDGVTNRFFVTDGQQHGVYEIDPTTFVAAPVGGTPPFVGFAGDGGPATQALLDTPRGVVVAPSGAIFVADSGNNRVRRIGPEGRIDTVLGTGVASSEGGGSRARDLPVDSPTSLAFDQYGNLLVSAGPVVRVVYADDSGEPTSDSLGGTLYDARLVPSQRDVIRCLTAAFSGNDGEIYVADACAGAVVLLTRL